MSFHFLNYSLPRRGITARASAHRRVAYWMEGKKESSLVSFFFLSFFGATGIRLIEKSNSIRGRREEALHVCMHAAVCGSKTIIPPYYSPTLRVSLELLTLLSPFGKCDRPSPTRPSFRVSFFFLLLFSFFPFLNHFASTCEDI